jgi:hypothetical protein
MTKELNIQIKYPEIGICGLSCRLCSRYHTESKSRCGGCKSEFRINGLILSNVIRSWRITLLSFRRMELMSLKRNKKQERIY